MKKTAFYHQHGREPLELNVVNEHSDGTVDLGQPDSEEILVCNCVVVVEAVPGTATLPLEAKPAAVKPARKRRGAAPDPKGDEPSGQAEESEGEGEEAEGEGEQAQGEEDSESATES